MTGRPSASSSRTLAAAIVLGSAIIALGLYFGLRTRASRTVDVPRPAAPPVAAYTPALIERVTRDAAAALAAQHATFVATCWTPFAARQPEPPAASVALVVSFDPAGRENARGVLEPRTGTRADVVACLREQPFSLAVPAPGIQVTVEVPLALP